MPDHDRQTDIRKVAKILREGGYSYDQSAHLIKEARRELGLSPPDRSGNGSLERLSSKEQEAFLSAAYEHDGRTGLTMRVLLETGARVSAFVKIRVEDISFRDLEIRLKHTKGEKPRDVPILSSLANELRLHIGDRETGWLFRSRQRGHYSKRRIQQIVRDVAPTRGFRSASTHTSSGTPSRSASQTRACGRSFSSSFLGTRRRRRPSATTSRSGPTSMRHSRRR
jgi:integrase/recombinase XerD